MTGNETELNLDQTLIFSEGHAQEIFGRSNQKPTVRDLLRHFLVPPDLPRKDLKPLPPKDLSDVTILKKETPLEIVDPTYINFLRVLNNCQMELQNQLSSLLPDSDCLSESQLNAQALVSTAQRAAQEIMASNLERPTDNVLTIKNQLAELESFADKIKNLK